MTRTGSVVRPGTPDDFPAIAELLDRTFGKLPYGDRLKFWNWRYYENPARTDAFPAFVVFEENGRIGGVQGLVPLRLKVENRELNASCGCDLAVDPKARSAGMKLKFAAMAKELSPLHLSTSANELANKITLALGGREIAAGRRKFLKPLKISGLLLRRWKGRSILQGIANAAIQAVLKPMDWILATWIYVSRQRPIPGGIVKDIQFFDNRFVGFWKQFARDHEILVVRDPAYLNWRYIDYPFPGIQSFELTQGSKVLGYSVLHIGRDEDHLCFAALLELVGLKSEPRILSHLLDEAIRRAARAGAHYIIARASAPEQEGLMRRNGFRVRDRHSSPVIYKNNSNVSDEMIANERNWYLSLGDGDEYFYISSEPVGKKSRQGKLREERLREEK